ncbi:MAG: malate synthase A, partial [Gaiellaceae bacterium]
ELDPRSQGLDGGSAVRGCAGEVSSAVAAGVSVQAPDDAGVLTPEALELVAALEREFGGRREELLAARTERQERLSAGEMPDFLEETRSVREGDWQVAPVPADLQDRRVEITGPTGDRKMVINAFNSGARMYMADFEDANSPTWENVVGGQLNLTDAIERTISLESGEKSYSLNDEVAVLLVRPRGWHLMEKHVEIDGRPVSASLFDFGVYFQRNAERLLERGTGPYFYLPKLESHLEARLWNDVFRFAQDRVGLAQGTIKATVLIETILAAFEMEEILYELRDHSAGLNAGRWDYIFSAIKKFRDRDDFVLPDRAQVTMTVPFMRSYTELLVRSCHTRGAHAIGGMAAFIPSRRDAEVNEIALTRVRDDKQRESGDGFDGTWVAHPDLVPVAKEVFDSVLGERPNQLERRREEVSVEPSELLNVSATPGEVTEEGVRANVSVGIRYIASWLSGVGAAAIDNLMEDAATAEISRSQVWQWVRHGRVERTDVERIVADVVAELPSEPVVEEARALFEQVALGDDFPEFLTLPAYDRLLALAETLR